MAECTKCDGTGSGGECGWCGGTGTVIDITNLNDPEKDCPCCDGTGIAPGPCNWCGGSGVESGTEED